MDYRYTVSFTRKNKDINIESSKRRFEELQRIRKVDREKIFSLKRNVLKSDFPENFTSISEQSLPELEKTIIELCCQLGELQTNDFCTQLGDVLIYLKSYRTFLSTTEQSNLSSGSLQAIIRCLDIGLKLRHEAILYEAVCCIYTFVSYGTLQIEKVSTILRNLISTLFLKDSLTLKGKIMLTLAKLSIDYYDQVIETDILSICFHHLTTYH